MDISSAVPSRTGIGTYTLELARRLVRQTEHEFVLLFNSLRQPPPECPEFHATNVSFLRRKIPGPLLLKAWQHLNAPAIDRLTAGPVDVFHSPATYIPPQRAGARVTTIHDLDFLEYETDPAPLGNDYYRATLGRRLFEMDAVIAVSERTAGEIRRFAENLGKTPPAIHVVPHGLDERFLSPPMESAIQEARRRYELPNRYILSVGGGPRKNLKCLLEAWRNLPGSIKATYTLVLAGLDEMEKRGIAAKSDPTVAPRGYIVQDDLPALYHGADLFVFPSRAEGFGLPLIEALACGVPAICSTEVAAVDLIPPGIAETFRPDDPGALGEILERLLTAESHRSQMSERGLAAAAEFSWEKCANKTLRVYEDAAGKLAPTGT